MAPGTEGHGREKRGFGTKTGSQKGYPTTPPKVGPWVPVPRLPAVNLQRVWVGREDRPGGGSHGPGSPSSTWIPLKPGVALALGGFDQGSQTHFSYLCDLVYVCCTLGFQSFLEHEDNAA